MAQQTGTYRLRGKLRGLSYYRSAAKGTDSVRSINASMSERVKTEPAFANTRLYANKFGTSCNIASKFVKALTGRNKYLIKKNAYFNVVKATQRRGWATRDRSVVPEMTTNFGSVLTTELSSWSKAAPPEQFASLPNGIKFNFDEEQLQIEWRSTEVLENPYPRREYTGIKVTIYMYCYFDGYTDKRDTPIIDPRVFSRQVATYNMTIGRAIPEVVMQSDAEDWEDENGLYHWFRPVSDPLGKSDDNLYRSFGMVYVVFEPYMVVHRGRETFTEYKQTDNSFIAIQPFKA